MELKIKLNEKETLTIELGEVLEPTQFKGLLLRLTKISRIIDDDLSPQLGRPPINIKPSNTPKNITLSSFGGDVNKVIEFFTLTNTSEGKRDVLEILSHHTKKPSNKLANLRWKLKKEYHL